MYANSKTNRTSYLLFQVVQTQLLNFSRTSAEIQYLRANNYTDNAGRVYNFCKYFDFDVSQ